MKAWIILVSILVVACLVLSGCNNDGSASPTPTPDENAEPGDMDLTEDDFDRLGNELEGLEFEDLGGLEE